MRGVVVRFALVLCANVAFGANYTDKSLPSTITLNGGQRQDTITSTKSPQGWQMTTIGLNRNPYLSINGAAGSQYALTIKDSTTTFYSSGLSVASGIESTLISAHTISIENGSVNIGNGAKLSVISSGNTINAQGSEYGGESKVRFGSGSTLNLTQNATADFSNAKFFIHNGSTNLSQSANLKISANTIRLQNSLTNNGGSVNLTGNVYNVGYSGSIQSNSVSNFTLNGGSATITGNFYNGIESKDMSVDTTGGGLFNAFDPAFGGGGNLIITNGGTMSVTGTLISQMGGDSINGGGIYNPRNSTISIYGGKLTATGGVQNLAGSTLTIGALNGKMGQIVGDLTNNGTFIVDAAGSGGCGQNQCNYTLITGNFSGNAPTLINGNSDFSNANLNGTTLNVTINQARINSFKSTLNSNESATLARFGESIYTTSGASATNLKNSANDINRAIFSAFYLANLATIESLSEDFSTNIAPRTQAKRKIITKRSAKTARQTRQIRQRQIRKISTKGANPNDLNAGFIIKGISQNSANGVLGGIRTGYGRNFERGRFAINFAYAYGNLKNALNTFIATQNLTTKSHNVALGANLNAKIAGDFGVDLGLSGFMIFANHTREIQANAVDSHLKSAQKIYQIAVDTAFVYDCKIANFLIAPYFGLNQGFLAMPKFAEVGGNAFALNVEAYNSYFLSAILGTKMGFDLRNYGAIFSKIDYKFLAYNAHKTHTLRYANSADFLIFAVPNAHKIAFDLGYHKDFDAWYLRVNGSFGAIFSTGKAKDTNANFYNYGINGTFGYRF